MPVRVVAQHANTNFNEIIRNTWITNAAAYLKTVKLEPPAKSVEIYDLKHFERNQLACSLTVECFVQINSTNWIIFLLHSAHSNPEVGDIILAMDQHGDFYHCDAHVCSGSASLRSDDLVMPISSADFFARFRSRGSDDGRWTKLNLE